MISKRCTTHNLVNHLLQTKKIKNYEVNYIYEKQDYRNEWMCVVSFESDKQHSYVGNSAKKRPALYTILTKINPILSRIAGIRE
jgi:hypothetical protein